MPIQKSLKVSKDTWQALFEHKLKEQTKAEGCVSIDKIIQKFLKEGTINLTVPKNMVEKLKREIKKRYGTEHLEEGIQKIIEDWVKERKKK